MNCTKLLNIWVIIAISLLMISCADDDREEAVKPFRVATQPFQKNKRDQKTFRQLIESISKQTGLKIEHIIPDSYEESLHLFKTKQVDLALLGGVVYVKAHIESGAIPLVMPENNSSYRSLALTHATNPANELSDLKGASMAFGSRLSTSGHFMPRHFFYKQNIIPETYFKSVEYAGKHDLTAEWVRDGKVDLGIVNSGVVDKMFQDGRLKKKDINILWLSPPFHDYVWAMQSGISKHVRTLIRDAFLNLNHDDEFKTILKDLGTNYFIPATHDDFEDLEHIITLMEQRKIVP